MIDRWEVTDDLNRTMIGFAEGTDDGLVGFVVRHLNEKFGMNLKRDDVKIVVDLLENPDRRCWSIHVDSEGHHYESVMVNLMYDSGFEM